MTLSAFGLAGPHELLLFMTAVFLLNATPGVDLLLTVSRTLQGGVRAGVAGIALARRVARLLRGKVAVSHNLILSACMSYIGTSFTALDFLTD